jgi:hypothetical protein
VIPADIKEHAEAPNIIPTNQTVELSAWSVFVFFFSLHSFHFFFLFLFQQATLLQIDLFKIWATPPAELDQLLEKLITVYECNFISEYEYKIRYLERWERE